MKNNNLYFGLILLILSINIYASFIYPNQDHITAQVTSGSGTANLTVINNPPFEHTILPNITFANNTNYSFNMSDYYIDPENIKIKISAIDHSENITIIIDNITSLVTIVPDTNFSGFQYVYYSITDGPNTVITNKIFYIISNGTNITIIEDEIVPEEDEIITGGSSKSKITNFDIDVTNIEFKVTEGVTDYQSFTISNKGNKAIDVTISSNLDFLIFTATSLSLEKGENKKTIVYYDPETLLPGIYFGTITVTSGDLTKRILITIEVSSKKHEIDAKLKIIGNYTLSEIIEDYESLKIIGNYTLLDHIIDIDVQLSDIIKTKKEITVKVTYYVIDQENKKIHTESEDVTFIDSIAYTKKINAGILPRGWYTIAIEAEYEEKKSISSERFYVAEDIERKEEAEDIEAKMKRYKNYIYTAIAAILMIIIIVAIMHYFSNKGTIKKSRKKK